MHSGFEKQKLNKLDNISVTAFRIISILNMLLKGPCNDAQINEKLREDIEESRELSKDTICIYLNTLRILGCEITRPTKKNNYKYILKSHPFKMTLSKNEIETLVDIRKFVSDLNEWKTALETDRILHSLLNYLCDDAKIFFLNAKKSSLKREVNSENFFHEIKQLESYCKQNKVITLLYNSPEAGEKNITLVSEKITMENGAFYLWGYSEELETTMYLRIDRILDIKSISLHKNFIKPKAVIVRYKLSNCCPLSCGIAENESILEKTSNELIIEAAVTNKFKFFQKILSYGHKCTIISPEEIKNEIVIKLEKMQRLYNDNCCV
ncbi:MAG TPA: WYL domain-containing protein [Candidatus Gastranaerophilales bacterium]|nr:WYL domain-containing protein [Candidatus Gastranaerophilales bacterium]